MSLNNLILLGVDFNSIHFPFIVIQETANKIIQHNYYKNYTFNRNMDDNRFHQGYLMCDESFPHFLSVSQQNSDIFSSDCLDDMQDCFFAGERESLLSLEHIDRFDAFPSDLHHTNDSDSYPSDIDSAYESYRDSELDQDRRRSKFKNLNAKVTSYLRDCGILPLKRMNGTKVTSKEVKDFAKRLFEAIDVLLYSDFMRYPNCLIFLMYLIDRDIVRDGLSTDIPLEPSPGEGQRRRKNATRRTIFDGKLSDLIENLRHRYSEARSMLLQPMAFVE